MFESIMGLAFGVFFMAGGFLANGGKWDFYSRSRTKPLSRFWRGVLFVLGLFSVIIAIARILSN